ncbi:MAG: hypothetical protein LBG26_02385, partial [Treponema sp.]|nr:hypothetical protein [Treponema sp.]
MSFFQTSFFVFLALAGCANPVLPSRYALEFPQLPVSWTEVLGNPLWKVEWYNENGIREFAVVDSHSDITIPVFPEWPSPVTAWPFWPDKGME